jgi:hypothetical protein
MGLIRLLPFTGTIQMEFTATWDAKAIRPSYVADRPCSISTTLLGRFPSDPPSFRLLASGTR